MTQKQLIRVAEEIREQIRAFRAERYRQAKRKLSQLIEQTERLQTINRQLNIATRRGWTRAADSLFKAIPDALRNLSWHSTELERVIEERDGQATSLRDIFQELRQLEDEFGELRYPGEDRTLSVVTQPIELEGVHLGDFEIRLHIPSLSEARHSGAYSVVALDPHPASANESVTHPHVSDERLCEGDASAALGGR